MEEKGGGTAEGGRCAVGRSGVGQGDCRPRAKRTKERRRWREEGLP